MKLIFLFFILLHVWKTNQQQNLCVQSTSHDRFVLNHVCDCNTTSSADKFVPGSQSVSNVVFGYFDSGSLVDQTCTGGKVMTWECTKKTSDDPPYTCTYLGLCNNYWNPQDGLLDKRRTLETCEPPCCTKKSVGNVEYRLVNSDGPTEGLNCINRCIYEKIGFEETQFCFGAGNQTVDCLDKV
eukprot:GFUD01127446.1.p1 GENE.GFUD01127446.1~~GFUD01127446.1.p1  ORF type:complete len:183 (+),score=13.56 GFUD01127446.1:3-551(+)